MDAYPLGGFDVLIHLDGNKVTQYEGLETIEELIALENPYIAFTGKGSLGETAGQNLSGGSDEEAANMDITAFIDDWEKVKFNTVAFPFDGEAATNVKHVLKCVFFIFRDFQVSRYIPGPTVRNLVFHVFL